MFYRKKEVSVLGGGDTALEEALYLANLCSKVYLIYRREGFRAVLIQFERTRNNEKIEYVSNTKVEEIIGDASGVTGVNIVFNDGSKKTLNVLGIFTFLGLDVKIRL